MTIELNLDKMKKGLKSKELPLVLYNVYISPVLDMCKEVLTLKVVSKLDISESFLEDLLSPLYACKGGVWVSKNIRVIGNKSAEVAFKKTVLDLYGG